MNIAVLFKVVPDDQDIVVAADRTLDYSKAKPVVSTYDLNAIEAAAQLAAANPGSRVVGISAGDKSIDDSKLRKNVLARGVDELVFVLDEGLAGADAYVTGCALAEAVRANGPFDIVVCGDGSADNYAQQVEVHVACALSAPVVTAVSNLSVDGGVLHAVRTLEDVQETVEIALPAVVSVVPDAALPRIPGMKDILAAGKKPAATEGAGTLPAAALETVSCLAPEEVDRRQVILEASDDEAIAQFAAALKAAM